MMRKAGLLTAGVVALAALASCTLPFTSRSTITPIYAATPSGLSVFDGSSWATYLAGYHVNAVTVYGSGANALVYAATAAHGVQYYDGTTWGPLGTGLPSGAAVTSIFLGNNYLYAGTTTGLYVYASSSNTWAAVAAGTSAPGTATTISDVFSNGTAYVAATGMTNQGLYIANPSASNGFVKLTASTTTPSAPPNASSGVTAVFVDQQGDLFAGTSTGLQILPYNKTTWSTVGIPNLPSDAISSIWVDPYLDIYVATDQGLAISNDGGTTWTTATTANGLGSNTVNQVFVVGTTIYAATTGGLSVSTDNGQTWTNSTSSDGLANSTVNGLFVSPPLYSFGS